MTLTAIDLLNPALAYAPVRVPTAGRPPLTGRLAGAECYAAGLDGDVLLVLALTADGGLPALHIVAPDVPVVIG